MELIGDSITGAQHADWLQRRCVTKRAPQEIMCDIWRHFYSDSGLIRQRWKQKRLIGKDWFSFIYYFTLLVFFSCFSLSPSTCVGHIVTCTLNVSFIKHVQCLNPRSQVLQSSVLFSYFTPQWHHNSRQ